MKNYTIILETPILPIPDGSILDFVRLLISRGRTEIEYFGLEIDNQADDIDEEMQNKIDSTTIIDINFEYEETDFDSFSEAQKNDFILDILKTPVNIETAADQKDISIVIWQ